MLERTPLNDIQNGNFYRPKIHRTYGKKGKTSTTMDSAKDLFSIITEVEQKLGQITIDENTSDDLKTTCVAQSPKSQKSSSQRVKSTKPSASRTVRTRTQKPKDEHCILEDQTPSTILSTASEDDSAISNLVARYSDRGVLAFQSYGNTIAKRYDVRKIGEGTYSSVFALTRRDNDEPPETPGPNSCTRKKATSGHLHRNTILKLLPILVPSQESLLNDPNSTAHNMTPPYHLASELTTLSLTDPLPGFLRYRGLLVVRGPWPKSFLSAFRDFRSAHRKKAENEDPEMAFEDGQYYALVEMEDAGLELSDALKRPSDFQCWDVFWSVAVVLTNAEGCGREFEHRDLHVSNICIRGSDHHHQSKDCLDVDERTVSAMTERPQCVLGMSGLEVTLIDYTFSRVGLLGDEANAEAQLGIMRKANFREFWIQGTEYNRLLQKLNQDKKPARSGEEFEGRMQQLTYAKAAKCVEATSEQAEKDGSAYDAVNKHHVAPWEHFVPRTNVCWLGYLIACLLGRVGKISRTKYVKGSNDVAKSVQDDLRGNMLELREILLEEDIDQMPSSATEVVRIGVEKGWLSMKEIEAFKEKLEKDS